MKMPENLKKTITYLSDECLKHTIRKGQEEVVKPYKLMVINGSTVCPRCEKERQDKELQQQIQKQYEVDLANEKFNMLQKHSLVEDNTLLNARLTNYEVFDPEEIVNKEMVVDCKKRFKDGQVFNMVLQGNQGAGKSHLAYGVLYDLNESRTGSCAFLNINTMMRKIKDSFNNKESRYTEEYFIDLMSKVDFLSLDDLGAETGAIDSDKRATDFVQRVLYAATTVRQDKVTILTTNLGSNTLYSMYDKKLISRLFKRPKFIVFKETKDKRVGDIPF